MLSTNLLPVSQIYSHGPCLMARRHLVVAAIGGEGVALGLVALKVMLFVCYRSDSRMVSDLSHYLTDQKR